MGSQRVGHERLNWTELNWSTKNEIWCPQGISSVDFWSSFCLCCSLLSLTLPQNYHPPHPFWGPSVLPQLSETANHCLWWFSLLYSRWQWTFLQQNVSWDHHWAHLDFPLLSAIIVWGCLLSNTWKQLFILFSVLCVSNYICFIIKSISKKVWIPRME